MKKNTVIIILIIIIAILSTYIVYDYITYHKMEQEEGDSCLAP